MKKLFLTIIITLLTVSAGLPNPDEILENVKSKINGVNDYRVEAVIKVDVNFLRVPETHATIFFKQPDKLKLESDGFALLPKEGLNFSPAKLLKDDYTAVIAKEEIINGKDVYLIKIIPLSDLSEFVLADLWIDKKEYVVHKIETTTKKSGTVTIELSYKDQLKYALPSKLKLSFKVEQMNLPPGMTGEYQPNQETQKSGKMTGTVIVEYKNYQINIGLSDEFFDETDK
ncbi:MAG TPA: outer membrane lipoprotein-sorting protein [Ignavibacteria bacterium]|nr:outer membrane lipoprotein-sorting protein [Ignavibacteria bacterium]